ncbi:flavodoxin [Bacillus sp. B15-48]|uniref:flavodoxin n=1 Tax=Bacillus sp. B15-48 TaxID=1548601 RepID=UPI00193FE7E0|nr:flavodoxin [Bacillus sp. B15-48]MBM4763825.1 flavodoxin [Bacillus sp. B15-48]
MNTIIVYCSMTGNTEQMAELIAAELTRLGDCVEVKDGIDAYADELIAYDRILIGSYTWGDGELPDEMLGFYEELQDTDLTGKIGAVFGAGDSSYDYFARAVDVLEETLKNRGCEIITNGLKVDKEFEEQVTTKCRTFCENITNAQVKVKTA